MNLRNLYAGIATESSEEQFDNLLRGKMFRVERIVSTGQTTPPGQWCDQDADEWVLLLRGAARLQFEGEEWPTELRAGDCVNIPAHRRHRVEWTDPERPTVWLAIHYQPEGSS